MTAKKRLEPVEPPPTVENIETDPEADLEPVHWSTHLFTDYDPDHDVVTLARLSPKEWQGELVNGYLCKLSPGHDEQWISDTYGGTKFLITRKNLQTGRIVNSAQLRIAGNLKPLVSADGPVVDPAIDGVGPMINVGGVDMPLSSSMADIERMMLTIKAIKSVFPDPPDINSVLLETLLRRNEQPSTLDIVRELKEAAGLFGGGGETKGGNFYDLLGSVAKYAGPVLANLTKAPTLRQPIGVGAGPQSGPTLESAPVSALEGPGESPEVNADTETKTTETTGERESMAERDIVVNCANQIVKCFRLKPIKSPEDVVPMLDLFIQQEDAGLREMIRGRYESLVFNLCEAELEVDWSDPESEIGDRATFAEWSKSIFALYADPERKVALI